MCVPSAEAMMWWRDDDLARPTDNRLVPVVEIWCWDGGCAGQIETIYLVSSSLFFYNRNVPEASKQRSRLFFLFLFLILFLFPFFTSYFFTSPFFSFLILFLLLFFILFSTLFSNNVFFWMIRVLVLRLDFRVWG